MNEEQIKELFSDEAFVNSILELENPEDVQKALADKGLELSLDEITTIRNTLQKQGEEELSEDDLENVSGGVAISAIVGGIIIAGAAISGTVSLGKAVHNWTSRRW